MTDFDFQNFIANEVYPLADEADHDSTALGLVLREMIKGLRSQRAPAGTGGVVLLTNDELEDLFAASSALAFTYWQHLAAVERLSACGEWQLANGELWDRISTGLLMCGLATSYLFHRRDLVSASEVATGYLLNGEVPWCSGFQIFDMLIIGFECNSELVFALVNYPCKQEPTEGVDVDPRRLRVLNGSSSVRLKMTDYHVPLRAVISRRTLASSTGVSGGAAIMPRPSRYVIPELGIGRAALAEADRICGLVDSSGLGDLRMVSAREALVDLHGELDAIRARRALALESGAILDLKALAADRDRFNHRAVRLLVSMMGSRALIAGSLAGRLWAELMLTDVVPG